MLEDFINKQSTIKIIDFFLDEPELDYSRQELIKETGVTWKAINEAISQLKKYGVITESRRIRGSTMYRLDKNSEVFNELLRLDKLLNIRIADEHIKENPT